MNSHKVALTVSLLAAKRVLWRLRGVMAVFTSDTLAVTFGPFGPEKSLGSMLIK